MTTLYFQGKWALSYKGQYLQQVQDSTFPPQIEPDASSIGPMSTFILYSPTLKPIVSQSLNQAAFQGYFQLQGNMQYIVSGTQNQVAVPLVATASDAASALLLEWMVTPDPNPNPNQFQAPRLVSAIVNANGLGTVLLGMVTVFSDYLGYYIVEQNLTVKDTTASVMTPGLYEITQALLWPNCDLSFVDLTGQDFSGNYQFPGSNFQQAILDQVDFTGANLSGVTLAGASLTGTIFNAANLSNTNFAGVSLIGAILPGANFTNTNFSAAPPLAGIDFTDVNLTKANFSGATVVGANFAQAILAGASFAGCNLIGVGFDSTTFLSPTQSTSINLSGATLPFALIGNNWQWLNLANATVLGMPSPLSTSGNVLQATGARLPGMNQNDFKGLSLQNAVLDYADLDGLDMSNADLTSASLQQASMHGTILSGATLVGTQMNGAQLGSLGFLFTLPLTFESALNSGNVSALTASFAQVGITISSSATLETVTANQVWELNDEANKVIYTIRLNGPDAQVYTVYWPAVAASLVNAYMPNAVLTGANLYGVLANGIQFYGPNASVDSSAILELAQLNDSNLSSLNLTQAQLMGANLSGSYLFNAQFNKANLTPSSDGVATNLSNANLQGADFTDAQLAAANLTNAAVAISLPTKLNPDRGGVYLFSLPYPNDPNTSQAYIGELNAAGLTFFSLNPDGDPDTFQKYVSALESNDLATIQEAFNTLKPPIQFSSQAKINTLDTGSVWQIVDMDRSYNLWTDPDEENNMELYAASSLPITTAGFHRNGIALRSQASVVIETLDQQWSLDNDSQNPNNFSAGYMSFLLTVNGSALDVYGTAIRIVRLGDNNQQEYDTEACNVTLLSVTNMSPTTICPNGTTLAVNQTKSGENWDQLWLRASLPPAPPVCVPVGSSFCGPTSMSSDAARAQGAD